MRLGLGRGHTGFVHEAAFYASDEDLLATVVPFVEDGLAGGEPTIVTVTENNGAVLRDAFSGLDGVTLVDGMHGYVSSASTIRTQRATFARLVADGAHQIRIVGDVPHPGPAVPWAAWTRYEAAINHAYDDVPVWGLCPYDIRTTPRSVLDAMRLTHRYLAGPDAAHDLNQDYRDPVEVLAGLQPGPDPWEMSPPALDLAAPTPTEARRAVVELLLERTALRREEVDGLELAISEIVTNALVHGMPPVRVRAWLPHQRRVLVTIRDAGPGVTDPYAGLLPRTGGDQGGLGMWIAHQSCSDLACRTESDGFTVTLVAGDPV